MVAFWFICAVIWGLNALYQFHTLYGGNFHRSGAIFALAIAVGMTFMPLIIDIQNYWDFLKYPVICLILRWNVFDPVLNLLRGKPWYYSGNMNRGLPGKKVYFKNGDMDQFFGWKQIPVKFVLIIVCLYLSIV